MSVAVIDVRFPALASFAPMRSFTRLAALCMLLVLAGCGEGDGGSATVRPDGGMSFSLTPPVPLLESRAVDRDALSVAVDVDGESLPVEPGADGTFVAETRIAAGTTVTITIRWFEAIPNRPLLLLASASSEVFIPVDAAEVTVPFTADTFDTSFDQDEDDRSNLAEREAGTDPFDASSPGVPVVFVTVPIELALPARLSGADASTLEGIELVATVNDEPVALTRDGNLWRGSVEVPENSELFLDVRVLAGTLRIAVVDRRVASGSGVTVSIGANDYRTEFDDDNDGLTNIAEIADGSRPLDSSDPPIDPCTISQFQPGCSTDTDGDGRTDAQETQTADRDRDGTPDYLESSEVDADGDGRREDNDADDTDPCIPSTGNAACQALADRDDDGVPDAEDNCPSVPNPNQLDSDDDDIGDACELPAPTPGGDDGGDEGGDEGGDDGGDEGGDDGGDERRWERRRERRWERRRG